MRLQRPIRSLAVVGAVLILSLAAALPSGALQASGRSKIEDRLAGQLARGGQATFWVRLGAKADLTAASKTADWAQKGASVMDALKATASESQKGVIGLLKQEGATFQPFWIVNAVQVTGPASLAEKLAQRADVSEVRSNRTFEVPEATAAEVSALAAIEWGVSAIHAPDVWSTYNNRGEGIVVATISTGAKFDHPALVNQYRGNKGGGVFDHNYSWWDPARICGNPSTTPCDNVGVGTHVTGTMVGDDQAGNQIGVAPGAKWISAKGCESTSCTQAALLNAAQWILAPTDTGGFNPRPEMRPHIVLSPWGSIPNDLWFNDAVNIFIASGIFPVFLSGNGGPTCNTSVSPGDYVGSYSVGAFDSAGAIAPFSGRGNTAANIKPDIAAPGVAIRSSFGTGYAELSTTASSAAHVAGTVALLWSAAPSLAGNVTATKALLDSTAVDVSDLACGGTAGENMVWGEGKLDSMAAVTAAPRSTPAPSFSVDDVTIAEGQFGTKQAIFTVTRTGASGGVSSVQVATSNGTASAPTDYTAFPPTHAYFGAGVTIRTVAVDIKGDLAAEPDETFNLVLSAPFNGTIADATGVGTITNDDSGTPSQFSINDVSVDEGDSLTRPARFTITRTGSTSTAASVKYSTSAGTATSGNDFTAKLPTTLAFTAGQTSKTVDIMVRGDLALEPNETFNVSLTAPAGATIGDGVGAGTIVNDDSGFAVNDIQAAEGDSGTSPLTFTVTRSGDLSGTSSVKFKTRGIGSANIVDYIPVPLTTLTFAAGESTKPVAVTIRGDNTVEGNETFELVLSAPVNASITDNVGRGTILNDD